MPKIKITEVDDTGSVIANAIANVVYIPGQMAFDSGFSAPVEPTLFTNATDFVNSTNAYDTTCASYKLAKYLLGRGMYVLYEGVRLVMDITVSTTTTPTENKAGKPVINWVRLQDRGNYDIRFLTIGGYADCYTGTGTAASGTTTGDIVSCAEARGDCVALLDHEETLTSQFAYILTLSQPQNWSTAYSTYYTRDINYIVINSTQFAFIPNVYYKITTDTGVVTVLEEKPIDWDTGIATDATYTYNRNAGYVYTIVPQGTEVPTWVKDTYYLSSTAYQTNANKVRSAFAKYPASAYASAFTPWFTTDNTSLKYTKYEYDTTTSTVIETANYNVLPATFGYLFAYVTSVKSNPVWYAVAGSKNGVIGELSGVTIDFTSSEIEMLQARATTAEVSLDETGDNVGIAINPIAYVRPFGYIVWGNRTYVNNDGTLKATSFLNVRNLVSEIKKTVYDTARRYTFSQNGETLWLNFRAGIIPLLDKMTHGEGILGYKVQRIETTAKARLKARITIIPIEAVEDFEIEVRLTDDESEITE